MADAPYLVALALVEFAGKRALPLTGKSQSAEAADAVDPGDGGRTLALELLLRLWQRSEEGPLQRAAGEASLLLEDPAAYEAMARAQDGLNNVKGAQSAWARAEQLAAA